MPVIDPPLRILPKESSAIYAPKTIQTPLPHWRGPAIGDPMLRPLPKESIAQFSPQIPAVQYPQWRGPVIDPPMRVLPRDSIVAQTAAAPPPPVYWATAIADVPARKLPTEPSVLLDPQPYATATPTPSILGWYYQQPDVPRQAIKESAVQIDPQVITAAAAPILFGWFATVAETPQRAPLKESTVQFEPQTIQNPVPFWFPLFPDPPARVVSRESLVVQFITPALRTTYWTTAVVDQPLKVLPKEASAQFSPQPFATFVTPAQLVSWIIIGDRMLQTLPTDPPVVWWDPQFVAPNPIVQMTIPSGYFAHLNFANFGQFG